MNTEFWHPSTIQTRIVEYYDAKQYIQGLVNFSLELRQHAILLGTAAKEPLYSSTTNSNETKLETVEVEQFNGWIWREYG